MWWFWSSLSSLYLRIWLCSSLWGLITMCCDAIQTRGNFPLPYSVPLCYSNKVQLSVAVQLSSSKGQFSFGSEVVHLKSKFRARWAVAISKNTFWEFLMKLTNFLKNYSIFPKRTISWTQKRKIFSAHDLTCMIFKIKKLNKCVNLTLILVKLF